MLHVSRFTLAVLSLPCCTALILPHQGRNVNGRQTASTRLDAVMVAEETTVALPEVMGHQGQALAQERQQVSSAGIEFAKVHQYLDELYPPSSLQGRNALSRTDGYWPFVHEGKEPPQSLTYGEFDVLSLAHLLEEALSIKRSRSSWKDAVFTDIGSGTGRMVLAAAALQDWKLCRGIELLPGLHDTAVEIATLRDERILQSDDMMQSPVELRCGSFEDEYFGDSDLVFCFSTCMNGETMELLGQAVRRQCRVGTLVITTDYPLAVANHDEDGLPKIRCIKEIPTWCQLVGGECIAFVHEVVE